MEATRKKKGQKKKKTKTIHISCKNNNKKIKSLYVNVFSTTVLIEDTKYEGINTVNRTETSYNISTGRRLSWQRNW